MKRIALLVLILHSSLFALNTFAQDDPVVMIIAGEPVTRSEFEYNYNKNNTEDVIDKKTEEEYVELFVNYKLKVRAAEDARLDTAKSYIDEFRTYRDQQIRPLLVPEGADEKEVRAYYDGMLKQLDGRDLRLPAHIFLRVPQQSTPDEIVVKHNRIDSLYNVLKNGGDFAELAKAYSEDPQSAMRGGDLTWFGPGQLVPEFEKVMCSLNKGELSTPFLSPVGYHIVLLKDCKNLEPYEELRPNIKRYLESSGLSERLEKQTADSLARHRGLTIEQLMDLETERLCAEDMDLKYLVKEYHDGLLFYEISKNEIWDPAAKDTAALKNYFTENKKKYAWKEPHYFGMVYHAREKADVAGVKKLLKKVDETQWTQTVRGAYNKDSVMVRMEQPRLYAKGESNIVDSLIFKVKANKTRVRKDYPYTAIVGRKLKNGPQKWTDVSNLVVTDYQAEVDRKYIEELRKRYKVELIPEALATVNKHD